MSKSNEVGAGAAAQAVALSRQAIEELMDTGATGITVESIFALVPTQVVLSNGDVMPLEQWQDEILRRICFSTIFPDYYLAVKSAIIGSFGAEMLPGGVSRD